jgi:hypothetical protein
LPHKLRRARRRGLSEAVEPVGVGYEWNPSQDVEYIAAFALLSRYPTPDGRVLLARNAATKASPTRLERGRSPTAPRFPCGAGHT